MSEIKTQKQIILERLSKLDNIVIKRRFSQFLEDYKRDLSSLADFGDKIKEMTENMALSPQEFKELSKTIEDLVDLLKKMKNSFQNYKAEYELLLTFNEKLNSFIGRQQFITNVDYGLSLDHHTHEKSNLFFLDKSNILDLLDVIEQMGLESSNDKDKIENDSYGALIEEYISHLWIISIDFMPNMVYFYLPDSILKIDKLASKIRKIINSMKNLESGNFFTKVLSKAQKGIAQLNEDFEKNPPGESLQLKGFFTKKRGVSNILSFKESISRFLGKIPKSAI